MTLTIFLVGSAVGCMICALAAAPAMIIAGSMLLSFAMLGAWGALYAYTPESYPTEARATGMGWAGAMARAAGILAPTLGGYLLGISLPLALGVYAVILIIAAAACPSIQEETQGQTLADTLSGG